MAISGYPTICLEELKNTAHNATQDNLSQGWEASFRSLNTEKCWPHNYDVRFYTDSYYSQARLSCKIYSQQTLPSKEVTHFKSLLQNIVCLQLLHDWGCTRHNTCVICMSKNLFARLLGPNSRFIWHEIMTFKCTLCTLFLLATMDLDGYQFIIWYQKNSLTLLCVLLVEYLC
jgi:hypothetical protein